MKPATLLDTARKLNQEAERNIFELGFVLLAIHETKAYEQEYERFSDFCIDELGRSKGFIAKLMASATYLKLHGYTSFPGETLTLTKLYQAIQAFPDKKPEYVLAAATENTRKDLEAMTREKKHGRHECELDTDIIIHPCKICNKLVRTQKIV